MPVRIKIKVEGSGVTPTGEVVALLLFGFGSGVVAVTEAVWREINAIPPRVQGFQSVRGRAHDVLWMAAMAARNGGRQAEFTVLLDLGRSKWQRYKMVMSPEGPGGAACVTIMKPQED